MTVTWKGVIPALMTEMHKDGRLDLEATARHAESCIAAGCEGLVMLGTLGENSSLSLDEKEQVVRTAVEAANGRVPVLAGIAEYTTDLAIATSKRMGAAGAAGLMVLPAMVYQQDSREAITHFRAVARAVDLPVMIYNNHVAYKVDLSPEDFAELADEKTIVAVKESSHDSRRMTDMVNVLGDRYKLFCGVDDLALENILFGAVGWVSGLVNSFPREGVALFRAASEGRLEEALALYRWFMPLLHLDTEVKLVQYIKLVNQMTGEGAEWVRAPRLTLIGEERARVEALVNKALETRPTLKAAA
ncbi:dihydrodipicolinate synthase family protein [Devosia nitrariae]|uniref:Dihydrodipicolinate synthase family protein n=1 Tax=Devosia nitrariae TaxID=2071872 RepID=A0ABQ5W557_9HYPH|nr:dihydrodipicolinate synthase family protein [Devosia nitrariae]GLQ54760.1 dihydrodipicolinate synthase family protein [Devosia nitrariae]